MSFFFPIEVMWLGSAREEPNQSTQSLAGQDQPATANAPTPIATDCPSFTNSSIVVPSGNLPGREWPVVLFPHKMNPGSVGGHQKLSFVAKASYHTDKIRSSDPAFLNVELRD
jgi:hypothetical protein